MVLVPTLLKWVLVVYFPLTSHLGNGHVLKHIENEEHHHELHGDGPWHGPVDEHLHELRQQKDQAIKSVEKHAEQKITDVQDHAVKEKQHIYEHELSLKHEIENKYSLNQNLALKRDLQHKLNEADQQIRDFKYHAYNALYNLDILARELELKLQTVKLQARRKLNEIVEYKRELTIKKAQLEKDITLIEHDIEHHKQSVVRHDIDFYNLERHKTHEVDLPHKYPKHTLSLDHHDYDVNRHRHIIDQDFAHRDKWSHHIDHAPHYTPLTKYDLHSLEHEKGYNLERVKPTKDILYSQLVKDIESLLGNKTESGIEPSPLDKSDLSSSLTTEETDTTASEYSNGSGFSMADEEKSITSSSAVSSRDSNIYDLYDIKQALSKLGPSFGLKSVEGITSSQSREGETSEELRSSFTSSGLISDLVI